MSEQILQLPREGEKVTKPLKTGLLAASIALIGTAAIVAAKTPPKAAPPTGGEDDALARLRQADAALFDDLKNSGGVAGR
jgi:hypothetical protein